MKTIIAIAVAVIAASGAFLIMNDGGSGSDDDGDRNVYAIQVDGVTASDSNISNGTYDEFVRNLVLCTKGDATGNVKCFLDWITSVEGQQIVGREFITLDSTDPSLITAFDAPSSTGKTTIAIGGSTSIQETMGALAEAYMEKYSFMNITITGGGSGVGASNTINGTFDIGMCSRDLKQSEIEKGLVPKLIGVDGVAVIVNGVGLTSLTMDQIAAIYSGEVTNWSQIGGIDKPVAVISREDGSGTRECFENGLKAYDGDWTLKTQVVKLNSTGAMINQVNMVVGAIGYISIGKLSGI